MPGNISLSGLGMNSWIPQWQGHVGNRIHKLTRGTGGIFASNVGISRIKTYIKTPESFKTSREQLLSQT